MISLSELRAIMPFSGKRAAMFLDSLNEAMREYEIDNVLRQAAFLAQVAHESGELHYVKELASGEAYDTGRKAEQLGNTPEADGDGERYKGRGLLQITGTDNYRRCGEALGIDLLAYPQILETPMWAAHSAAWFWAEHRLNELADRQDFKRITRIINGGYSHYDKRLAYYERALAVLGREEAA